jgi:enediyne core biosynthesis thioesterase
VSKVFEYTHRVTYADTNAVGNVYFVNHVAWQGRCREEFLRVHTPEVLERVGKDLYLVTMNCSCQYIAELMAFDLVTVRMRLAQVRQNRMTMLFEYYRVRPEGEEMVATGKQEIAFLTRNGDTLEPAVIPLRLLAITAEYQA